MANERVCAVADCGKPYRCCGYCNIHYRRFKRFGDPHRVERGGNKKGCILPLQVDINVDRLVWHYVIEQRSSYELAEMFGCSKPTVLSRLRAAGVALRHHNDTKRGRPARNRQDVSVKKAVRLYSEQNASIASVSAALRVNTDAVRRTLVGAGVRIKTISEVVAGTRSGANNANWNPNLTDEERSKRRPTSIAGEWRRAVYERDGFACQKCGDDRGGNLNAHHLVSHHADKEKRWLVSNGVTLCDECHRLFHKSFGYRNNTEDQFAGFMRG